MRVKGLGFGVQVPIEAGVEAAPFEDELLVWGLGFRFSGLGCRV